MTLSVLALLFLVIIIAVAVTGTRLLSTRSSSKKETPETERCSVCRQHFAPAELILRQVGDYKLLYFCKECILKLYADLGMKN
jgi:hypothetical protein